MGLHRDGDEETFAAPVVSLSLGDSAVFRIGGAERRDPTTSLRLHSGDVVVLAGPSRLSHHGIDRVLGGSSPLLDRPRSEETTSQHPAIMRHPVPGLSFEQKNTKI